MGCLMVHPSVGIELFVVGGVAVELRPYRNHVAAVHGVDAVEHCLRIGVTAGLKLMAAPLVVGPIVPVLHDVVNGDMTLAKLCQRVLYIC